MTESSTLDSAVPRGIYYGSSQHNTRARRVAYITVVGWNAIIPVAGLIFAKLAASSPDPEGWGGLIAVILLGVALGAWMLGTVIGVVILARTIARHPQRWSGTALSAGRAFAAGSVAFAVEILILAVLSFVLLALSNLQSVLA
jgi:hypothetical protein